jgi:hypothetical protein
VGANPVDRGKPGSKLHLVCDGGGLPLTAAVTGANVADVTMLAAVVDDIPPVRTPSGRRRVRPDKVHADKGMTAKPIVRGCGGGGSGRGLLDAGSSCRPGLAATAGGWSGRCRGLAAGGGCSCGGTETRGVGSRSSCWLVRSSASTGSNQPAESETPSTPSPAAMLAARDTPQQRPIRHFPAQHPIRRLGHNVAAELGPVCPASSTSRSG